MSQQSEWLSLKQAAERLGVHTTTLRRWADNNEIRVMLTPGGHRRFTLEDVDHFAEQRRRLRVTTGLEKMWADQALTQTRAEIASHQSEHWLSVFNEKIGNASDRWDALMGLMLKYISLNDGGDDLMEEARGIGREHANNALSSGLPLVEAIQAMLFFRDTMVEVAINLPETAHVHPEANTHLLRRINTLLNAVQLAIAETYDNAHK